MKLIVITILLFAVYSLDRFVPSGKVSCDLIFRQAFKHYVKAAQPNKTPARNMIMWRHVAPTIDT